MDDLISCQYPIIPPEKISAGRRIFCVLVNKLLASPVLTKGAGKRNVVIPAGQWKRFAFFTVFR
jgi:hypothetical protein